MTDQSFRSRLSNCYLKLNKSNLATKKDTSNDSLAFFEQHLNEALPNTSDEHEHARVIKDLYHNSPRLTYRVITAERDGIKKQSLYVLWTNAWCITRHFEIQDLIHLAWDQEHNKYHITVIALPKPITVDPSSESVAVPTINHEWQQVDKRKNQPPRKGKRNERRKPPMVNGTTNALDE